MAMSTITIAQTADLPSQSGDPWPMTRPVRFACLAHGGSARYLRTVVEAYCTIKSNRATELHVFGDARSDEEMQTMATARAIAEQRACTGIWFDGGKPIDRQLRGGPAAPLDSAQLQLADILIMAAPESRSEAMQLEMLSASAKPLILLGHVNTTIVTDRVTGREIRRPAVAALVEAMQEIAFNPTMLHAWHVAMLRQNLTASPGVLASESKLAVQ